MNDLIDWYLILFYIHNLDMAIKSLADGISSTDSQILDRICEKILPRIYHQIDKLIVEPYSMKRILLIINFSQVYSLSLLNFPEVIFGRYTIFNFVRFNEQKTGNHYS
jgi:hypothetical protein